ncbi:nucleoside hydrolase [Neobittarella massiliensis]|uniref:Nucleoside hydrolase n=2 Tax=Oscillospiraceae TaxID=216572 RepID=A0A8J6IL53_9FIRM|nr:nucleoside hydrolase [Neobittarella massiliensis]MBC3516626.1 nucleoside hydrolase [Neobittarella massiliensis]SCJ76875.1 Pyrimidine-specific ribonucleoside hydrolase rihA [uncultured Anaerotruncus sp.]
MESKKIPIIIDCDPGIDDVIAIMLAHSTQKFDILGITPVAGNVPAVHTRRNARDISEFLGINCPVAYGADGPLLTRDRYRPATGTHGESGIGQVVLPPAKNPVYPKPAWDFIYEKAVEQKGELIIVATGPLTNIAITLLKYPDLPQLLKGLYIMGGSTTTGNVNELAEFNIWVDVHAADIVYKSGIVVTQAGCNVCLKTGLPLDFLAELSEMPSRISEVLKGLVAGYSDVKPDPDGNLSSIIYDAVPFLALIDPDMVTTRDCHIDMECSSSKGGFGATLPDFSYRKEKLPVNCHDIQDLDMQKYRQLCVEMVKYYSEH